MAIQIALIASLLLQFGAFFITISLIPKTKFNIAWISISFGFMLMALRRLNELLAILQDDASTQTGISNWIAVVISIAMFIASIFIRKIFMVLNRLDNLRRENEARVLRAIISTEEKERRFFSKELHDGLGPILSALKMSLSAIDARSLDDGNKEILHYAEKSIDSAILTTKEISNHLNPQVLEHFGLETALRTFIKNTIHSKTLNILFSFDGEKKRVPHTIEIVLYRAICELLQNTLKHAKASKVNIEIAFDTKQIQCLYADNGSGLHQGSDEHQGSGLLNITSRLRSVDGHIFIEKPKTDGFSAKICIPL